eukprot:1137390-Pelagomonas_calceolata.AAC.1
MDPHAPKGQRTLFESGCTKRKRTEADGQPRELRTRLEPTLAARVQQQDQGTEGWARARAWSQAGGMGGL